MIENVLSSSDNVHPYNEGVKELLVKGKDHSSQIQQFMSVSKTLPYNSQESSVRLAKRSEVNFCVQSALLY
jgi:hypothetical protein